MMKKNILVAATELRYVLIYGSSITLRCPLSLSTQPIDVA